ncbi:MAG: methylmalonyl Co-A mutase-associated GTPase MeaB [Paludibacteraceae bacterium]|nr:methylmalonyl Co-A mutase-associated GTPase MeaB [Paludibacteraceae bacterium]
MQHPENSAEYAGLTVNEGVISPPSVNPYSTFRRKRRTLSPEEYYHGILNGDISILGQAVTLVESSLPSDQVIAQKVIELCLPHAGKSIRLGITGVPGAGKSTFIESLGTELVRQGKKLAVLAIDPSSERTKGSILGDKTRMTELSASKSAFIRPSPSAGSLGGVARKTRETIVLCEAAGFNTIFVETVGVGQSETAAHSMVDFFLLLQVTGTGDELQGIKRGIMEMADGIAINKCDGNNREKAEVARTQFRNALALFPPTQSGWKPDVKTCSSIEGTGITDVWKMVEDYIIFTKRNGFFNRHRTEQAKYWMYETINSQLLGNFYNCEHFAPLIEEAERKVLANEVSSFTAANRLLDEYFTTQVNTIE